MGDRQETYRITPIGIVRSSDEGFMLEILEPYRPALKHLEAFSHVHVFWWAHELDHEETRRITQAELPYAEGVTAGVFACRAEYRPNPIAVTTCYLLGVDEATGIVRLAWIDAFDGTPLVDLKPYIPISDRVRDVRVPDWLAGWPEWMEDGAAFFAEAGLDVS